MSSSSSSESKKLKMPAGAKMPKTVHVEPIKTVFMSLGQWAKVADNPIQKKGRAARPNIGHLRKYVREHSIVRMGVLPNGQEFKIEGHTRNYIWQFAPWLVDLIPDRVQVEVFPCKNFKEAAERFRRVDNKSAVKNAADEMHGSFKLIGVETNSKFFQTASNIKAALSYAYEVLHKAVWHAAVNIKKVAIDEQVAAFKDALTALDAIDVNRSKLTAPLIMAFLLAHTKHGDKIVPFFKKINEGTHGQRKGKKYCPIAMLESKRDKHKGGGRTDHIALAAIALGVLDTYMEGNYTDPEYVPPIKMCNANPVGLDLYLLKKKSKRRDSPEKYFTR
jgi:hypothetical protein